MADPTKRKVKPKPKAATNNPGTLLTDYDHELAATTAEYSEYYTGQALTDALARGVPEPVTLMADEPAIARKKKKKLGAQQRRSGRASTILSDTLG